MNCLLVINRLSGNSSKVHEEELIRKYAAEDAVSVKYIEDTTDSYSVEGIDKLIICGGDGTLNKAINLCRDKQIDIYYLPFGTFNETAKGKRGTGVFSLAKLGRLQDSDFSYVAAAGSFTDIGNSPSAKSKHRFKILAYFSKVLSSYKVHTIDAEITTDTFSVKDTYTLIMLSNAKRCFGFRFNRLYKDNSDELQILLIKAPKKKNLWGKIKMFFPFFRAFFIGFSKEYRSKNILFTSIKKGTISLSEPVDFCIDGEAKELSGALRIDKLPHPSRVFIIKE